MVIRTQRLVLREFQETDTPAVHAYHSDPRYLRFFPWDTRTLEDVEGFVGKLVHWRRAQPRTKFQLAIELPDEGGLIGNCGIRLEAERSHEAEIGCELNPRYWGRGYGTEAVLAMLGFGFDTLNLRRIWAQCVAENGAAARLVEKAGMRRELHLRNHKWMKNRAWDLFVYAMHYHEWVATPPSAKEILPVEPELA